jgi:DNA topoisomerase-3
MTTLYLAEKPSQARDLAKVIGTAGNGEGYIPLKGGDAITWGFGHLLTSFMPEDYDKDWSRWRLDNLPLLPPGFKKKPGKGKTQQLNVIKRLLREHDRLVIATDAGREGELIAREILDYYKYKGKISRLWLSSLVEEDIRKALAALRDGKATEPLYDAARAREESDWIYGLSMTRAATLQFGGGEVMPVGRVKTPTLAMVVKRCQDIENFSAKAFYELEAHLVTAAKHHLVLRHAPAEDKRILDVKVAEALARKAEGAQGPLSVKEKTEKERAPLLFATPDAQTAASNKHGLGAQGTLDVLQALYEKKVITYPRTSCAYLGVAFKQEIPAILAALRQTFPQAVAALEKMGGPVLDSRLFDDSKLTDHHGLLPTKVAPGKLSEPESHVYRLVALRALEALAPDHVYRALTIAMDANGVMFGARGKTTLSPGWTSLASLV